MLVCTMETPGDMDTPLGKTVGRRRAPVDPLDPVSSTKASASAWHEAFKKRHTKKGVFRFNSHEEADKWLWKMLTRKN